MKIWISRKFYYWLTSKKVTMKNRKRIQEEVDKTLDSLDGMQRASANPYLFTRVKAMLGKEEKNFWGKAIIFISRPSVAVSTIVFAIFITTAIFFESESEKLQAAQEEEQVFASEYNLSANTIYDSTIEP